MTLYPDAIFGGYGFGLGSPYGYGVQIGQPVETAPDATPEAKPQKPVKRDSLTYGSVPDFGLAYPDMEPWSLWQAWQMRCYSAVSLSLQALCGPILAGQRGIEIVKADGTPAKKRPGGPVAGDGPTTSPEDEAKAAYERLLSPLWPTILSSLNSLWLGFWPQEVQYGRAENLVVPTAFEDFTFGDILAGRIILDPHNGKFARLRYTGGSASEQTLAPPYVYHSVCNADLDPLRGIPRTFFAREPWWRAQNSEKNGDRLERKASGINLLLHIWSKALGDGGKDFDPTPLINALAGGGVGFCERSLFPQDVIEQKPELLDNSSPVKVDQFNWGSTGPDIMAQITRLDSLDKRIARGIGVPERALMEATVGGLGQGDSKQHGDQVDDASDQEHKRTLRECNAQWFDPVLVTNHGPSWKGRLRWVATSTDTASEAAKDALIKAVVPGLSPSPVDVLALLKERKVPTVVGWTPPAPQAGPGEPGQGDGDEPTDDAIDAN